MNCLVYLIQNCINHSFLGNSQCRCFAFLRNLTSKNKVKENSQYVKNNLDKRIFTNFQFPQEWSVTAVLQQGQVDCPSVVPGFSFAALRAKDSAAVNHCSPVQPGSTVLGKRGGGLEADYRWRQSNPEPAGPDIQWLAVGTWPGHQVPKCLKSFFVSERKTRDQKYSPASSP